MLLGTCLGSGMLALPLAAAQYSYSTNLLYLILSWAIMTIGAFSILEVHLWMPSGSNLFTMSNNTLGKSGNLFALCIYLLLLYALIAAYIAGCSDIFYGYFNNVIPNFAHWQSTLIVFSILFCIIIYGIRIIDLTNRLLMLIKLSAFIIMLGLMLTHVDVNLLDTGETRGYSIHSFTVMITAFGFAIILPSLREYLEDNHRNLTLTLVIGCLIPLVLYSLWILAVQGLLPKTGNYGLISIANSQHPNSSLIAAMTHASGLALLINFSKVFISISAVTSFLGVGLCLVDFVRDMIESFCKSFACEKGLLVYSISFAVPLFIVLYDPGIFIKALSYAGILVLTFLVFIPITMLYIGRYKLSYVGQQFIPGGKLTLGTIWLIVTFLLIYTVLNI